MNYRHLFHAGNFADLVKHACLTALLARMTEACGPLCVIDTHAGAGVYDLNAEEARRSGEASAGVGQLMATPTAPAAFDRLKAEVKNLNPSGGLTHYPGSPPLIAGALRAGDSLIACELRPDDCGALERCLSATSAQVLCADGYGIAASRIPTRGAALVLIDPPFERGDEYAQVLTCVRAVLARNPAATILIWSPLKDLETFDGFLRGLEAMAPPPALIVETRLRPLDDPMRLNGCALVVLNPPPGLYEDAASAAEWVVETLGEPGGQARIWRL